MTRRLSLKSARRVETVAREFDGLLNRLIAGVWRGGSNQSAFERSMLELLSQYIHESYVSGFTYGGGDESELDETDRRFIATAFRDQRRYVSSFAADVFNAVDQEDLQASIMQRLSMWTSNVRSMGDYGQASVDKNQVMEFRRRPELRRAKETCHTRGATQGCAELLGKRMRWKDIMARGLQVYAGNPKFTCRNYNCVHGWFPVKGKT